MAWSPAVLSLLLQIKTQGNREGKKLHLIPARLPEEGTASTCLGSRRHLKDANASCVLTSQAGRSKGSPAMEELPPRD